MQTMSQMPNESSVERSSLKGMVDPIKISKPFDSSMDNSERTGATQSLLGSVDSPVEIEVSTIVVGRAKKPTRNSKVGIRLRKSEELNSIIIDAISEDGLLASSGLTVGQKVLSINGTPCPNSPADAARIIGEVNGELAIEAAHIKKNDFEFFSDDEDEEEEDPLPAEVVEVSRTPSEDEVVPEDDVEIKPRAIPTDENNLPVNNISEEATMNYLVGLSVAVGTILLGAAGYAYSLNSKGRRISM